MRFRNSFRLMIENFGSVFKMLLYKLIVALIFISLTAALLVPRLVEITSSTQWIDFIKEIKGFFTAVAAGDVGFLSTFQDGFTGPGGAVENLLHLLKDMLPSLVFSLLGIVFFYFLKRIADTIGHYAIGDMLDDKMVSFAETSFSSALVRNLGRAFMYSLVYVPLMLLYDILTLAICYFLFFYLLQLISFSPLVLSLFLTITFIVAAQALKMTLTGGWLPSMTTGKEKVSKAMKLKGKMTAAQFAKIFSSYIVTVYLLIVANVVAAICTIGSALLLTIPASYFMLICVQYVNYYTLTGRKYFLAFDRVFVDPSKGDSAHYLDAVGEAELSRQAESAETAQETVANETAVQENAVNESANVAVNEPQGE